MFRKIATILLLTFLLFNWVGYWLFISWFESRETAHWEARLDNEQYDTRQLILLKVSADMLPYSNASTSFERTDGDIQIGNIHYRYVRKRLYNDSVEFLCIADQETSRLRSVKHDLLRLVTDIPDSGHGKSSSTAKASQVLLKAFREDFPGFTCCNSPARLVPPGFLQAAALRQGHTRIGKQPPQRVPALS